MLTRRGWGVLLAGLLGLLLAVLTLNLLFLLLPTLVLALAASEVLLFEWGTRDLVAESFVVERASPRSEVVVGEPTVMDVHLRAPGAPGLWTEIYDVLPDALAVEAGSPYLFTWWAPGEELRLAYTFSSTLRGEQSLGPVRLVLRDPLGLAWRGLTVGKAHALDVQPRVPHLAGARILRALPRAHGLDPARRRGYGTEFRTLRPYQPGDDIRTVAWKRTRPGQWVVREFEQEVRRDLLLLVDVSPPMAVGTPGQSPLDRTVEAGLLLAEVLTRQESRLGLLGATDRPQVFLPPERGRVAQERVRRALAGLRVEARPFSIGPSLSYLARALSAPTHILAFTALRGPLDDLGPALSELRGRSHHLYVFAPEVPRFYPPLTRPVAEGVWRFAREDEARREALGQSTLRTAGVPVVGFGREGAAGDVLGLYARIRSRGVG